VYKVEEVVSLARSFIGTRCYYNSVIIFAPLCVALLYYNRVP